MAPGSLYISANTASGRRIEATADGDGYFTTADMDGRVNYQTGVVTPERLEYIYYYLCRIIFRGVEDPERTVGEIIEMV